MTESVLPEGVKPYYQEDGIAILHGDARELLPQLPIPAVILTDPPYGIEYVCKKPGERWRSVRGDASWAGKKMDGDADASLRDWLIEWADAIPMLVFGSWKVARPSNVRAVLIWDKGPAFGMGDLNLPWKLSWEEVYVLGKGFSGHRDEGVIKGFTGVTWESKGRGHPTEKPVKLLRYLLTKCPDGLVADPFCGSGTTLRAAKDLGRHAIGIEIEEKYCEIAAKRLSQTVLDLDRTECA